MKDDYLWDRSGEPDPDVQELETLLGTLRFDRPAPDFSGISMHERLTRRGWTRMFRTHRTAIAIPAFAALAVVLGVIWWSHQGRASYPVVTMNGTPRIGSARIEGSAWLSVGQWLETDASSRAKINVGDIGQVEVEPNTRIGLTLARQNEHRLALQRGTMHALIWAPPGQFHVATPSAVATDLGCAYTLQVDAAGAGLLTVTMGWVAFERDGREAFVPAGAVCATRPGIGPGTPYQGDASPAFRAALTQLDFQSLDRSSRTVELKAVLAEARAKDALTLWHLFFRSDDVERGLIYDRLASLVPPPPGVTRAGVLSRNRQMLDLWWDALGFGDMDWWRMWKRPWVEDR